MEKINLTSLKKDIGEDPKFLIQLLSVCLSSIESFLKNVSAALKEESADDIMQLCHKVSPTFTMLGLTALCKEVQGIETDVLKLNFNEISPRITLMIDKVATLPDQVNDQINDQVKKL